MDGLALIRKILRSSESQAGYKKVTCNLLLHGRTPSTEDQFQVYGEELLCYSMFSNLLKNALEASPKGGVITITLDGTATGDIGIHNMGSVPMAIRHNFFKKYTTSGKSHGTELGAYSAKLMAETQQGNIHLTTSDEAGTTITVRLPTPPGQEIHETKDHPSLTL